MKQGGKELDYMKLKYKKQAQMPKVMRHYWARERCSG